MINRKRKPNRMRPPAEDEQPFTKGFTLIELVTAAAIFSILGVMLFTMIRSSTTLWKEGEFSRNETERGVAVLEAIASELRLTFSENDPLGGAGPVRFLCDFFDYDTNRDGIKEARVQRLRFVRINVEEGDNEFLRNTGDSPFFGLGGRYYSLVEEDPKSLPQEFFPTGGLAEAAFMLYSPKRKKGEAKADLHSLYRGYRTPIGGEDSFFVSGILSTPEEIERLLLPVFHAILHLEFRFWGPYTQGFEPLGGDTGKAGGGEDGWESTWDSTRALLSRDPEDEPNSFRYGLGDTSLEDVTDDIFPSRIKITVVVGDNSEGALLPRLIRDIGKRDLKVPLDIVRPFEKMEEGDRFVRIDEEWIGFTRVEGGELKGVKRGARHTLPAEHSAGSPAYKGKSFSTIVEITTAKSCWNDEE